MSKLEIEHKYKISNFVPPRFCVSEVIKQGYVFTSGTAELRVRSSILHGIKQVYTAAVKVKTDNPNIRHEMEQVIDPGMGRKLMKESLGTLVKHRYTFKRLNTDESCSFWHQLRALLTWDVLTWEVDVYPDTGLMIAEVEVSDDKKQIFFPQDFQVDRYLQGAELKRYSNRTMALRNGNNEYNRGEF